MLINFPGSLQEGGLRVTAFHRGGLQKLAPGSPPEEQSSSFFSSSSKAEVLGQRKTQGQSPRTPPLSTSLMGNTSQQLSHCCPPASLADGRRDGELVPRLWWQGRLAAPCRHAAPDAPLANPLLPWTQTILSLSLSSAVGVPVWISHHTVLIID